MGREVRGGVGFLGREAERSCKIGCFASSTIRPAWGGKGLEQRLTWTCTGQGI